MLSTDTDDQRKRAPKRSSTKTVLAVVLALATHGALFAWLMFPARSTGLIVRYAGAGPGMAILLGYAPRSLSFSGSVRSPRTDLTPPHPASAPNASRPFSLADSSDATATPLGDTDPSTPAAAAGPSSVPAMSNRLGVLPTAPLTSTNPWMRASLGAAVGAADVLDLWPEVAPCWKGPPAVQAVRLKLTLDPYGYLIASAPLEDDDAAAFPPSIQTLKQARAAVAACSPYVDRGAATTFEVIFPFTAQPPSMTGLARQVKAPG